MFRDSRWPARCYSGQATAARLIVERVHPVCRMAGGVGMTTIAWDGEYMAADSVVTVGGRINALDAHKLKRGRDLL